MSRSVDLCEPSRPRVASDAKNGGSERGTGDSAIHHQLDGVDVGGIVRRKKEHGFGDVFRVARPRSESRTIGAPVS